MQRGDRGPRLRLRPCLAWLHLWLGLVAGTVFALVSLAGTVLVFHDELLLATRPALASHAPVADAGVMGRLLAHWPSRGLTALDLPREDMPVWQGYFADGSRAYFAPDDGRLLLVRSHDDDWLMWLHHWHVELLGGAAGKEVLGVVGWIALGLMLSGLYLWWPKRGRMLAQLRWHAGPPVRRWLSWHRSSGVLLLPLLGLATLTGLGMVYSSGFRTALVALLGERPAPTVADATVTSGPIDWPAVLQAARTAVPGARLARVAPPAPGATAVVFRLQSPGEWHPVGRSLVGVSRDGRAILLRHDATADRPGARLSNAIYPLHVAAVGGTGMKLALALTGLLPAFLLATGLLFWCRRRARRESG
jgi:uncharacterized iron-regulated membrane protein